jgi:ribosome-dependent ATPase
MACRHAVADDSPLIELDRVFHRYGKLQVLDNVSLKITQGQLVGLIGPDGAGKSTVLSLIAGVRKIQRGQVKVLAQDFAKSRQRKRVLNEFAFMPQGLGSNLYYDLTIAENLHYFARLFAVPKSKALQRIDELLRRTGLSAFTQRKVRNLSGGMKQKLGLCCALVHAPKLLIMDEPTTGVDPLARQEFWHIIADMRQANHRLTVLVATAYLHEAGDFDQLILMDNGQVIAQDSPARLKKAYHTEDLNTAYLALLSADKELNNWPEICAIPSQTQRDVIIEAHELTKRFDHFIAVDRVSFTIYKGEIFGFLGPNGCGKTTTMKMLTGLLPPSEGQSKIFGQVITPGSIELRRRIGYMSQSFSLYGELTVRENLALHAGLFNMTGKAARQRIAQVIELCDLTEILSENSHELPVGQKQRLSLAVAILHQPEVLILDEPTSGVDPVAREIFWRLIVQLATVHRMTVFVSTHYIGEATHCHRIALLNEAHLLAMETPAALIEKSGTQSLEEAFSYYIQQDMNK